MRRRASCDQFDVLKARMAQLLTDDCDHAVLPFLFNFLFWKVLDFTTILQA